MKPDFGNSAAEIQTRSTEPHRFVLFWSHYLILMRIKDANALSKDKDEVIRLATEGQVVEKPSDIIKNPITLERREKDALIKLTLPENANIYATEYALYLPDKNELQARLKEWIEEFDQEEEL